MTDYKHVPVMLKEVLEYLPSVSGGNCIDCTLGGAGYTVAIAEKIFPGRVLAIDLDGLAIANANALIKKKEILNIDICRGNFNNVYEVARNVWPPERTEKISGIVLDLGLSSAQLMDGNRGFSFQLDAPLEMRFGGRDNDYGGISVEKIVNDYKEQEIENIIKNYGEERYARGIAKGIVIARKNADIKTTKQLVEIIARSVPGAYRNGKKIHFATRTFQALRIAANNELASLESALRQATDLLMPGGRVIVISYHSLEDRIVKHFFRNQAKNCVCAPEIPICRCGHQPEMKIVEKKAILPSQEEIKTNPRSRSAKLRVAEKR